MKKAIIYIFSLLLTATFSTHGMENGTNRFKQWKASQSLQKTQIHNHIDYHDRALELVQTKTEYNLNASDINFLLEMRRVELKANGKYKPALLIEQIAKTYFHELTTRRFTRFGFYFPIPGNN